MKCHSLFSVKNMKNTVSLSSAELAQRVVMVKLNNISYICFGRSGSDYAKPELFNKGYEPE